MKLQRPVYRLLTISDIFSIEHNFFMLTIESLCMVSWRIKALFDYIPHVNLKLHDFSFFFLQMPFKDSPVKSLPTKSPPTFSLLVSFTIKEETVFKYYPGTNSSCIHVKGSGANIPASFCTILSEN